MLQDVDGYVAVEEAVLEAQACLAVAGDDLHFRKALSHFARHVLAQLDGVVVAFLLRRQLLMEEVFTETGADLDRGLEPRARMLDWKLMIEGLYESIAARQMFMP